MHTGVLLLLFKNCNRAAIVTYGNQFSSLYFCIYFVKLQHSIYLFLNVWLYNTQLKGNKNTLIWGKCSDWRKKLLLVQELNKIFRWHKFMFNYDLLECKYFINWLCLLTWEIIFNLYFGNMKSNNIYKYHNFNKTENCHYYS